MIPENFWYFKKTFFKIRACYVEMFVDRVKQSIIRILKNWQLDA